MSGTWFRRMHSGLAMLSTEIKEEEILYTHSLPSGIVADEICAAPLVESDDDAGVFGFYFHSDGVRRFAPVRSTRPELAHAIRYGTLLSTGEMATPVNTLNKSN